MATQDITHKDDEEKKQIENISNQITAATQNYVSPQDITPTQSTHPLPTIVQSQPPTEEKTEEPKEEPEVVDIIKGFQGKMRTGNSGDFLKSKMGWLSKKNKGAPVTLKSR